MRIFEIIGLLGPATPLALQALQVEEDIGPLLPRDIIEQARHNGAE